MDDRPRFPEFADLCRDLTQIEFIWLIGWNIADGRWGRIGLEQLFARHFLLDLLSKLHEDPLDVAKKSCGRLQQRLMALQRGTFEDIQQESPFSRRAQRNMDALLRAWMEDREAGYARVWEQVFQPGWETAREFQEPIQIFGDVGDCEERALKVKGAPDRGTRVAAEWWYLHHTFGGNWTPGVHFTTSAKESAVHFSVHNITVLPDIRKQIYFRLPW